MLNRTNSADRETLKSIGVVRVNWEGEPYNMGVSAELMAETVVRPM